MPKITYIKTFGVFATSELKDLVDTQSHWHGEGAFEALQSQAGNTEDLIARVLEELVKKGIFGIGELSRILKVEVTHIA